MVIYKTTNLINNKIYIGKDTRNYKNYYGSGKIIKKAIKKYGIKNFKKEILETCQNDLELCEKEKYWIVFFNSRDPKIGYNITEGGTGGKTTLFPKNKGKTLEESYGIEKAKEIRLKMSLSNKGKILSDETKKKISLSNKGKVTTFETKQKIRKVNLGRKDSAERRNKVSIGNKGKIRTEEFKKNLSEVLKNSEKYKESRKSLIGKNHSEEHKKKISKSMTGEKNHFYNKKHTDLTKNKMKNKKIILVSDEIVKDIKEMRKKSIIYKLIKEKYPQYSITKIISIINQ